MQGSLSARCQRHRVAVSASHSLASASASHSQGLTSPWAFFPNLLAGNSAGSQKAVSTVQEAGVKPCPPPALPAEPDDLEYSFRWQLQVHSLTAAPVLKNNKKKPSEYLTEAPAKGMRAASWANSCRVVSQPRTNHRQRQVFISFKGCSLHAWRAFWPHGRTRVLQLNQRFHAAMHHALNSLYSESSHAGPSTIVCQVHAARSDSTAKR